ncbi:MAG: alpha/beta hydrolase-fold protein [Pyrinomonadaceae bacterium]
MTNRILLVGMILIVAVSFAAQTGTIKTDEFHFASLEGNLVGDSPNRSVIVYLPPGYEGDKKMRYPVVYLLHGYGANVAGNKGWVREGSAFVETTSRLITEKKISPMIIVMPDGSNRFGGSMYTNSVTTGNWEDYIVRELVAFIDKNYRTLPKAESRGIAGTSMGGYGALKIAMKHPDVFGAVYGNSSCCLVLAPPAVMSESAGPAAKLTSFEEAAKAPVPVRISLAYAAAFSPNPSNPPFYSDHPASANGSDAVLSTAVLGRWQANTPINMVDQSVTNLRRLRVALDIGTQDRLLESNRQFRDALKRNRIEHTYEEFDGGHTDKTRERIGTKMLPFFSRTLVSKAK